MLNVSLVLLLLLLLLLGFRLNQSIEIVRSGQIRFSSKSIGTILYVDVFNSFEHSISLSAVVEQCCRTNDQCQSVRLLGGDFGRISSKMNRSINFLWPGLFWIDVDESIFCEISIFFGFRTSKTHHQYVNIPIHSIPIGFDWNRRSKDFSSSSLESPFQISNSPIVIYPRCDEILNLMKNQCETFEHLRQSVPHSTFVSRLKRFRDRSFSSQRIFSNKTHFQQLIIISLLLIVLYIVLLLISCLFICSTSRQHHHEENSIRTIESKFWTDEHFSLVESSIGD